MVGRKYPKTYNGDAVIVDVSTLVKLFFDLSVFSLRSEGIKVSINDISTTMSGNLLNTSRMETGLVDGVRGNHIE
jgi:hypothetical protein